MAVAQHKEIYNHDKMQKRLRRNVGRAIADFNMIESDIKTYAEAKAFPIIPCTLCGSQDSMQRQAIKQMLIKWDKQNPGRAETIFTSIQYIVPSHLLDTDAFEFTYFRDSQDKQSPGSEDWLLGSQD